MKKALIIVLAVLLTFSVFAGCDNGGTAGSGAAGTGSGSSEAAQNTNVGDKPVLNVSVFAQEHEQAMYKEIIAQFEEANNCSVNFQVAGDQYWPELEAALTAGTAPDVFYLGVSDVKKRVWADKVVALDAYLDVSSLDQIWPEALNLYKYDVDNDVLGEGAIYALPKDFSAVSMTVNRAIIEKRRTEIEALIADGTLPFSLKWMKMGTFRFIRTPSLRISVRC